MLPVYRVYVARARAMEESTPVWTFGESELHRKAVKRLRTIGKPAPCMSPPAPCHSDRDLEAAGA